MAANVKHAVMPASAPPVHAPSPVNARQRRAEENPFLRLQRAIGNQAVQRSLHAGRLGPTLQRKCASCEEEEHKKMQTKLAIHAPGDVYEQEADRVADAVVSGGIQHALKPSGVSSGMQRCSCAAGGHQCEQCKAKTALQEQQGQASDESGASSAPPAVSEALRSSGEALQRSVRENMEGRFGGHDFSGVRVHTDARAADSARSVNALAYTVGKHVVFGSGQYAPSTRSGQHLLAHELTHVLQQSGSGATRQNKLAIGAENDPAEHEADRIANTVLSENTRNAVRTTASAGPVLRRQRAQSPPYTTAQTRDERRNSPPIRNADGSTVVVTRSFWSCPCARVPVTRQGAFYNPAQQNLTIAYRRCHGDVTFDAYLQTANAFTQGQAPPQGDVRIGINVNVVGREQGGVIRVEGVGENTGSGPGVGGHAQLLYERGQWRIQLESNFLHRFQGANPNDLQVSLSTRYGDFHASVTGTDLLNVTRGIQATGCFGPEGSVNICVVGTLSNVGTTNTPGISGVLQIPLDPGQVDQYDCHTCVCPAPVKKFECAITPPPTRPATPAEPTPQTHDYRIYFQYDTTNDSEEAALASLSQHNVSAIAGYLARGLHIDRIVAFASPEGSEPDHNVRLSQRRADAIVDRIHQELIAQNHGNIVVPNVPAGQGELAGHLPGRGFGRNLIDAVHANGFQSVEQVQAILTGREILRPELRGQFLGLFRGLTADERLQFFGLEPDSPSARAGQEAIDQFMRSSPSASRPWDRVFRFLRYAHVTVSGTEIVANPNQEAAHPTSSPAPPAPGPLSQRECDDFGHQAEAGHGFGEIAADASQPTAEDTHGRDRRCPNPPEQHDLQAGCSYDLPPDYQGTPVQAPPNAPVPVPGTLDPAPRLPQGGQ